VGTSTPGRKFAVSTDGAKTDTSTKYVQNLGQSNESSGFAQLGLYFKGNSSTSLRTWQVQPSSSGVSNDGIVEFNADGGQLRANRGIWFGTDTAAANALDDYEEGTWTPTLNPGTVSYSAQYGSYTKIGRSVTVICVLTMSAVTSLTSSARISGLPFLPMGVPYYTTAASASESMALTANHNFAAIQYGANSFVYLFEEDSNGGMSQLNGESKFTSSSKMYFTLTYNTNA
jgi:hypothetical protein